LLFFPEGKSSIVYDTTIKSGRFIYYFSLPGLLRACGYVGRRKGPGVTMQILKMDEKFIDDFNFDKTKPFDMKDLVDSDELDWDAESD
jgi:hypothetical protein